MKHLPCFKTNAKTHCLNTRFAFFPHQSHLLLSVHRAPLFLSLLRPARPSSTRLRMAASTNRTHSKAAASARSTSAPCSIRSHSGTALMRGKYTAKNSIHFNARTTDINHSFSTRSTGSSGSVSAILIYFVCQNDLKSLFTIT